MARVSKYAPAFHTLYIKYLCMFQCVYVHFDYSVSVYLIDRLSILRNPVSSEGV